MTISKILYGHLPSIGTMLLFCALLGIFAIGAPGVPGGTVMASLGLITGVLMFDDAGTALMLAIFALQDSFGTACNVTGDGALTLMLTGYAGSTASRTTTTSRAPSCKDRFKGFERISLKIPETGLRPHSDQPVICKGASCKGAPLVRYRETGGLGNGRRVSLTPVI